MYNTYIFENELNEYINNKHLEYQELIKKENLNVNSFNATYEISEYQGIYSIHIIFLYFTGGAHNIREDKIFYYNSYTKKWLTLDDIIKDRDTFYTSILTLSLKELEKQKELLFDDYKNNLSKEAFQYIMFSSDEVKVIFPPYTVGPWSSGEIDILIPIKHLSNNLLI